jgi:DNA-binding protein H-NS
LGGLSFCLTFTRQNDREDERYGGKTMTDSALAKLTLDDLWSLHKQVCSVLDQKLEDEKRKLQRRLDELGRKFGGIAGIPQQRPKVEPKFRNPEDPSMTWSGRGKQPRWIIELLAAGRAIEDFRISEAAS